MHLITDRALREPSLVASRVAGRRCRSPAKGRSYDTELGESVEPLTFFFFLLISCSCSFSPGSHITWKPSTRLDHNPPISLQRLTLLCLSLPGSNLKAPQRQDCLFHAKYAPSYHKCALGASSVFFVLFLIGENVSSEWEALTSWFGKMGPGVGKLNNGTSPFLFCLPLFLFGINIYGTPKRC